MYERFVLSVVSILQTLLHITMDASDLYWHRAQVTLQPDTFGILFEFEYDDGAPHGIVGIDDVVLLSGECFEYGERIKCHFYQPISIRYM